MSILVFGGTGSIGSGIVAALCREGEPVAVSARRPADDGPLVDLADKFSFYPGDITDPD
ncbi:MAG TPA: hypothetical protein DCE33_05010, partial [Rhodospirillaceae bacterium]|nr:hypothetical protein [Rhodospirillaceae bacterium]